MTDKKQQTQSPALKLAALIRYRHHGHRAFMACLCVTPAYITVGKCCSS